MPQNMGMSPNKLDSPRNMGVQMVAPTTIWCDIEALCQKEHFETQRLHVEIPKNQSSYTENY
jgi:hypothetical protein